MNRASSSPSVTTANDGSRSTSRFQKICRPHMAQSNRLAGREKCEFVMETASRSPVRHQYLPHRRHVLQAVEALVELVEAYALADHAVDRQLAL